MAAGWRHTTGTRRRIGLFLGLGLALAAPAAGAGGGEVPGVWWLNAAGTGPDAAVRLVVGGTRERPPASAEEVVLGWAWSDREAVASYPDPERRGAYQRGGEAARAVESWAFAAADRSFPALGVGPADELWLLAGEGGEARAWSELLDAVEAAFRHSILAADRDPLAAVEIGTLGSCRVLSIAVAGAVERDSWAPRRLAGHALAGDGDAFHAAADAELAAGELIVVRRFLRWVERPAPGEACVDGEDGKAPLRLFPHPGNAEDAFFLAVSENPVQAVGFFDLDPDLWTPGLRSRVRSPALPATVTLRFSRQQGDALRQREPVDLCRVEGLATACRRNEVLRQRLYTAGDDPVAGGRWPAERHTALVVRCRKALAEAGGACTGGDDWAAEVSGYLRSGYTGAVTLSQRPTIVGTRIDAGVRWQLQLADEGAWESFRAAPTTLTLLDGSRLTVADVVVPPSAAALLGFAAVPLAAAGVLAWLAWRRRRRAASRGDLPAAGQLEGGVATAVDRRLAELFGASVAGKGGIDRAFRGRVEEVVRELDEERQAERETAVRRSLAEAREALGRTAGQLREEIRAAIEERLADAADSSFAPPAGTAAGIGAAPVAPQPTPEDDERWAERVAPLVTAEVEGRLAPLAGQLARLDGLTRSREASERLAGVLQAFARDPELADKLTRLAERLPMEGWLGVLDPADPELRNRPRQEQVQHAAAGYRQLGDELADLPAPERERTVDALEAAGRLGYLVDQLWPALRAASGKDLRAVAESLPEQAREEWQTAYDELRHFAAVDAVVCRRLVRAVAGDGALGPDPPSPAEGVFLERSGWLDRSASLPARLRAFFEPYERIGRLGRVTLALQFLLEAYPIEQLEVEARDALDAELARRLEETDLPQPHRLVAALASGLGLRYRPVALYKTRLDQPGNEFLRRQVSAISLSERVGFAATADAKTVVRLQRPFFDGEDGVYYAGHAHIARG